MPWRGHSRRETEFPAENVSQGEQAGGCPRYHMEVKFFTSKLPPQAWGGVCGGG